LGYPPQEVIGTPDDSYDAPVAAAELAQRPKLKARPFVVLIPGRRQYAPPDWLEWQKRVARLSTSSMLVRVETALPGSIQFNAPDLTAEAFRLVVVAARRGAPLPRCAATRLPQNLWGTCLNPTSP
jgi:hypothetical protein